MNNTELIKYLDSIYENKLLTSPSEQATKIAISIANFDTNKTYDIVNYLLKKIETKPKDMFTFESKIQTEIKRLHMTIFKEILIPQLERNELLSDKHADLFEQYFDYILNYEKYHNECYLDSFSRNIYDKLTIENTILKFIVSSIKQPEPVFNKMIQLLSKADLTPLSKKIHELFPKILAYATQSHPQFEKYSLRSNYDCGDHIKKHLQINQDIIYHRIYQSIETLTNNNTLNKKTVKHGYKNNLNSSLTINSFILKFMTQVIVSSPTLFENYLDLFKINSAQLIFSISNYCTGVKYSSYSSGEKFSSIFFSALCLNSKSFDIKKDANEFHTQIYDLSDSFTLGDIKIDGKKIFETFGNLQSTSLLERYKTDYLNLKNTHKSINNHLAIKYINQIINFFNENQNSLSSSLNMPVGIHQVSPIYNCVAESPDILYETIKLNIKANNKNITDIDSHNETIQTMHKIVDIANKISSFIIDYDSEFISFGEYPKKDYSTIHYTYNKKHIIDGISQLKYIMMNKKLSEVTIPQIKKQKNKI